MKWIGTINTHIGWSSEITKQQQIWRIGTCITTHWSARCGKKGLSDTEGGAIVLRLVGKCVVVQADVRHEVALHVSVCVRFVMHPRWAIAAVVLLSNSTFATNQNRQDQQESWCRKVTSNSRTTPSIDRLFLDQTMRVLMYWIVKRFFERFAKRRQILVSATHCLVSSRNENKTKEKYKTYVKKTSKPTNKKRIES